jgi:hypothetical protein
VYFPGDCMDHCGAKLEELKNALWQSLLSTTIRLVTINFQICIPYSATSCITSVIPLWIC